MSDARIVSSQLNMFDQTVAPSTQAAVEQLSKGAAESRGAIFTRREVVEFILDLAGYTVDKPLHQLLLLEPSFGDGDFLFPIVERLLTSYRKYTGRTKGVVGDLRHAIRAVELHQPTFACTRGRLLSFLKEHDIDAPEHLADLWLAQGDFLLEPMTEEFSHIVGNPPYVRQELIPDALLAEYRRRFQTTYDRADIYIPFIFPRGSGNTPQLAAAPFPLPPSGSIPRSLLRGSSLIRTLIRTFCAG